MLTLQRAVAIYSPLFRQQLTTPPLEKALEIGLPTPGVELAIPGQFGEPQVPNTFTDCPAQVVTGGLQPRFGSSVPSP